MFTSLVVAIISLVVAGCGEDPSPPVAASTTHTQTPSPQQSRSVMTRVVGSPLVFRVRGATKPTPDFGDPQLRYVLIFRLNRAPRFPRGAPKPSGAATRIGNVKIADLEFDDEDYAIFNFDPVNPSTKKVQPDRHNCFIGEIRNDRPRTVRALNVRGEERVRVRIRLLTPRPDGGPTYAPARVFRPRIRDMRVEPTAPIPFNRVASLSALRTIQRLGCSATILDYSEAR